MDFPRGGAAIRGRSRLIGFMLTVLAFAVPAAQGNMITNGDFSSGLDGWGFLASGVGEAPLGETAASTGSGYLSMQADDAYYTGQQAVTVADMNLDFSDEQDKHCR